MADARFSEDFWTDPKIRKLDHDTQRLFIYLFTNPHRNYCGLYYLPKAYMREGTGLSDRGIDRGIDTLISGGFIEYSDSYQMVFVKNMLKHQAPNYLNDNQIKGIVNHLSRLHRCPLIQSFLETYKSLNINYSYTPIDTPLDTPTVNNLNLNTQSQSKSNSQSINTYSPQAEASGPPTNNFSIQTVAAIWNELAPSVLSRVNLPFSRPTKKMKILTSAIRRKSDQEWWTGLIGILSQRPFLLGENDRGWKATMDFVIEHAEEIADGKYSGTKAEGLQRQRMAGPLEWLAKQEVKDGAKR